MVSRDPVLELQDHLPKLRRKALSLTRNSDDADDLVQDTLERALAHIASFTPGTSMIAWLMTILRNLHTDRCRRRIVRSPELPLETAEHVMVTRAHQNDGLEVRDVERAFGRLSQSHRDVIRLVGLEGFSYERAAERLGVEVGTIKSRLSRARAQFRRERQSLDRPGHSGSLPSAA